MERRINKIIDIGYYVIGGAVMCTFLYLMFTGVISNVKQWFVGFVMGVALLVWFFIGEIAVKVTKFFEEKKRP